MAGAYDIVVAAGVEAMTRVPMGSSVGKDSGWPFGPRVIARYEPVGGLKNQGIGAEMIADQWDISREDLDAFSAESHRRAAQATAEGRFEHEIVPVYVRDDEGHATDELMKTDEGIRPDSIGRHAGQPEARLQGGRQGHRRQLLADHRRRLGGA